MPDLKSWLFGAVFDCAGILIICLPLAQLAGRWRTQLALKVFAFAVLGAVGGFGMLAAIGAIASWFRLEALWLGTLGLLPGAITAILWALFNLDLLKEPSLA